MLSNNLYMSNVDVESSLRFEVPTSLNHDIIPSFWLHKWPRTPKSEPTSILPCSWKCWCDAAIHACSWLAYISSIGSCACMYTTNHYGVCMWYVPTLAYLWYLVSLRLDQRVDLQKERFPSGWLPVWWLGTQPKGVTEIDSNVGVGGVQRDGKYEPNGKSQTFGMHG